ncbi:Hsp20/alpha crystallin family protein [Bdellovibrio sp. HCB2-146]|uniref:Hsp20/alpha crystallin family protein n=1 Tax=Bdellovibrio sp. HCB2-146 TaxID=3394362 RepID=UPI0039BC4584
MRILTPYWTHEPVTTNFFDEVDRVFADLAKTSPAARVSRNFNLAGEIAESAEHYLMSFDLPGMKKEDIKIEMKENILTISGERKQEARPEGTKNVQSFERVYGAFKKSFSLPTTVDEDKIEAQYENGVLSLYLPKTPVAQAKTIEINSEKGNFFGKSLADSTAAH